MRKLKQLTIVTGIFLLAGNQSYSQQQKVLVSLSGGPVFTNGGQKNYQHGNGYSLHADGFVPFYRKGWDGSVKGSGFTLGINAGIDYISLKNLQPATEATSEKYQVYNGTTGVSNSSFKKYSTNVSGLVGLQAQFTFGKFMISPIINTGYISIKQQGYVQTGNFTVNGQALTKGLVQQDAAKESGILIKPQIKFGYSISDRVQLYLGSAFVAGPQMEYTMHTLVPQGGSKENNVYETDQIKKGTYAETMVKNRYQTGEIHLGISIGLGNSTSVQARKKPRGKVTKPGDNGLLHATSNTDSTKKPGGAVSSSYAAGRAVPTDTTKSNAMPSRLSMTPTTAKQTHQTNNPDSTKKPGGAVSSSYAAGRVVPTDTTKSNAMPSRLSMTPTTTRQTHQTDNPDSTKNPLYEAGDYNGNNPLYNPAVFSKPGSPIGGIVVKGGKNPGPRDMIAVSNENGEVTLTVTEAGAYTLQITTPEAPGKSISEQGVKGNPTKKNKRTGRTYTGGRKNEASTQNMLAAPGNPIGGVIVKGGKNPGPRDMLAVSNENGEVTFTATQTGEYTLQITTPETPGKSISEQSIQRSESAKPGSPIGGIVVKGGKNPGGNMISVTSNGSGKFELNGLEAGNYQFNLTLPSESARPGSPIGGIVVKGGKNPGGNMINLTVDKTGTIRFEVLEAGDYQFIIQTPANPEENKGKKEKVIEKASSGLKDTLKTNV